ncbi:MAG: beta-galactosidase [Pseudobutyrivibrio sp.]|nr:beta-galactosidase [Pseudobutyrivibrio sp.]
MQNKKFNDRVNKVLYGGDYNPEQWPEEIWQEDMKLLKEAHINELTLNVFSWAALQPSEDVYDFSKLDKIMKLVKENGFKVMLATSTGAHPAWMAHRHPDILRTEFDGRRRKFGGRHNSCPNSKTYMKYAPLLAKKLAERYKDYGNIVAWHISNEYGGCCYCENCEKAFRQWLKDKYKTIENLNRAWNLDFWGHTIYDWDEIVLPDLRSEYFAPGRTQFQGMSVDYKRFNSDSILKCYKAEYDAIKEITPDIPITTNLMGFYYDLDYKKWSKYMDFVSWDNYPSNDMSPAEIAMGHDLMRSLKQGQSFVLMEQTPSVTNWQPYNALKRPGVLALWSYQAMAHGADAIQYFQMRRTKGACEALHGAVIDHVSSSNTRVYREVQALGNELENIDEGLLGSKFDSKIAIYFDWNNWWAINASAGPSQELDYIKELRKYYCACFRNHVTVDFVGKDDDLSGYKLLIAPVLFMSDKAFAEKVEDFVKSGGTFVITYFSGMVDEEYLYILGGYPGYYKDVTGIWVEESDALPNGATNSFFYNGKAYDASLICDIIHPVDELNESFKGKADGLEILARYEMDFYANTPVITKNQYGKGRAYYIGTSSTDDFYDDFIKGLLKELQIKLIAEADADVEVTERYSKDGVYTFILNHSNEEKTVQLQGKDAITIAPITTKILYKDL